MNKRSKISTVISLLLAICLPELGMAKPRMATILDGQMQIGLPEGYCINKGASKVHRDSAVIFLGRCSQESKKQPALISITVGKGGSAGAMTAGGAALAAFFRSEQGRATLSRRGKAEDIEILEAIGNDRQLRLYIKDQAVGKYWRVVTAIRGRLLTISTIGTTEEPLGIVQGRRLLDATLMSLRQVNQTP